MLLHPPIQSQPPSAFGGGGDGCAPGNAHDQTVLIVEDEQLIALDVADDLESWGFEICAIAASLREAMLEVDAHRPALALVDVALGDDSGIEVARLLRSLGVDVVFLTAHSDPMTRLAMESVEPIACLFKPYSPELLRRVLGRRNPH